MTCVLIYSVESSLCLALFYMAGKLVAGNDSHHSGTRIYWMISIILAFLLPVLSKAVPVNVLSHAEGKAGAGVPSASVMAGSTDSGISIDATAADMILHIVLMAYLA